MMSVKQTLLVLFIALVCNNPSDGATVSTFSPIGFTDDGAGISGFEIEDFEDVNMIPGLTIEWSSPDLGPISVLPGIYAPSVEGFASNTWDGSFALNNNQQQNFFPATNTSDTTTFHFAPGASSMGIGISNLEFTGANSSFLQMNGVDIADFDSFSPPPLLGTSTRSIYIRVDACAGEIINSIGIRGGNNGAIDDFLVFDRLAVSAVPEPTGAGLFAGTILLFSLYRRTRRQVTATQ